MGQINDTFNTITTVVAGGGALLAAGAGDATEVTGTSIDRQDFEGGHFLLASRATLAANKKLDVIATLEHADDNGSGAPSTFAAAPAVSQPNGAAGSNVLTVTDSGAGSTVRSATKINIGDISKLKRWIRLKYTPDLNAGATDTAEIIAVFEARAITRPRV